MKKDLSVQNQFSEWWDKLYLSLYGELIGIEKTGPNRPCIEILQYGIVDGFEVLREWKNGPEGGPGSVKGMEKRTWGGPGNVRGWKNGPEWWSGV